MVVMWPEAAWEAGLNSGYRSPVPSAVLAETRAAEEELAGRLPPIFITATFSLPLSSCWAGIPLTPQTLNLDANLIVLRF